METGCGLGGAYDQIKSFENFYACAYTCTCMFHVYYCTIKVHYMCIHTLYYIIILNIYTEYQQLVRVNTKLTSIRVVGMQLSKKQVVDSDYRRAVVSDTQRLITE